MNAIAMTRTQAADSRPQPVPIHLYDDPLDPDQATDLAVTTTRRGLTRLALVAAETGARFQREALTSDPVAWMLSPRRLFGGGTALEATLNREPCLRAVLLHGLSIGLDAEPATIDALLVDHDGGDRGSGGWEEWPGDRDQEPTGTGRIRRQRLYSTIMVIARGGELVHLFHASVAPSPNVVRERIRSRFGSAAADQAQIRIGVDLTCETTLGLLPPAFHDMVARGRRIRWASMAGLDVTVEHRIPC